MSASFRRLASAALGLGLAILLFVNSALAQSVPAPGFVRTVPIERGAGLNDQPVQISDTELRSAFTGIQTMALVWNSGGAVFNDKELGELVPSVVTALGKASPREDVIFAVFGKHGMLGDFSTATATTGRVFVQDGQLNIIFGLVHATYEDVINHTTTALTPGTRSSRVEGGRPVCSASVEMVSNRTDWLRVKVSQLASLGKQTKPEDDQKSREPAKTAAPAVQTSPTTDGRYQDIQSRLRVLDRLKADGLITEDEYRDRRRAILQSL